MRRFGDTNLSGALSAWALFVTAAVVAWLGYQQYRWIDKVAQVEEKISHDRLDNSLRAFADDFDTEITRAHLLFFGLDGETQSEVLQKAQERLLAFRRASQYPDLIASVDTEATLAHVPPYTIDPGPPLALVLPAVFAQSLQRKPGMPFMMAEASVSGALEQRTVQVSGPGIGIRFRVGTPLWMRVALNQKYIASVLLPRLLERHLGSNAAQHYDLLIRSVKGDRPVLQWNGGKSHAWESTVRIFAIRRDCLLGPGNSTYSITSGARTFAATTGQINGPVKGPPTLDTDLLMHERGSCSDTPNKQAGLWVVNIRARPSLSETIHSARLQSLATRVWLSCGI